MYLFQSGKIGILYGIPTFLLAYWCILYIICLSVFAPPMSRQTNSCNLIPDLTVLFVVVILQLILLDVVLHLHLQLSLTVVAGAAFAELRSVGQTDSCNLTPRWIFFLLSSFLLPFLHIFVAFHCVSSFWLLWG